MKAMRRYSSSCHRRAATWSRRVARPASRGRISGSIRKSSPSGTTQAPTPRCFCACGAQPSEALQDEGNCRAPAGERIAVVLDIDETALSELELFDRCRIQCGRGDFSPLDGNTTILRSSQLLLSSAQARAAECRVFFITGRRRSFAQYTVRQLASAGYEGWAGLFMEPVSYDQPSVVSVQERNQEKADGRRVERSSSTWATSGVIWMAGMP